MRKALLIVLLTAVSNGAMADWVAVGASTSNTLYADPSTIRDRDGGVSMWSLADFKTIQRGGNREPFMSVKAEYEYDCRHHKKRLLFFTMHTGKMAEGEVVGLTISPGDWTQVEPGSGLAILWNIACGKP